MTYQERIEAVAEKLRARKGFKSQTHTTIGAGEEGFRYYIDGEYVALRSYDGLEITSFGAVGGWKIEITSSSKMGLGFAATINLDAWIAAIEKIVEEKRITIDGEEYLLVKV